MTEERKAFEAWATDYFGANVSYPEACFDAWQAALRAQPADPFKKLSDAQVLWLAESHGIDVYASNPLAFYADLISTTPAQPDHSEQHLEMVAAARAVVERWDTPLWKDVPATAVYINRLRDALPAIGETT